MIFFAKTRTIESQDPVSRDLPLAIGHAWGLPSCLLQVIYQDLKNRLTLKTLDK